MWVRFGHVFLLTWTAMNVRVQSFNCQIQRCCEFHDSKIYNCMTENKMICQMVCSYLLCNCKIILLEQDICKYNGDFTEKCCSSTTTTTATTITTTSIETTPKTKTTAATLSSTIETTPVPLTTPSSPPITSPSSTTPSPIPSTNTFTTPVLTTTTTLTTSATSPDQGVSLAVEINLTDYTGMKVYASATKISLNIAEILNPELEVNLPPDLLSGLKHRHAPDMVKFIFSVSKTPPTNWTVDGQLGKILFGIEVENITISHLSTPFNINFKHKSDLQEKENTTCVYHNQSRDEWVTDGCHTLRLTNQTICSCDHFSFFALMHDVTAPTDP
ncbi:adhesion G-protein coupled receptor G2-like isoform 2-T2 [Salvelinus alpinus]